MRKLFILLLIIAFFTGCGDEEKLTPLTSVQSKVISYLPEDTQVLVYMNLNDLRKTEYWENYFRPLLKKQNSGWLGDFEKKTGAGFGSGTAQVFVASVWSGNNVIAVRFDKNIKKIKSYFRNENIFKVLKHNGKEVYQSTSDPKTKFYFADDSTLLVLQNESYLNSLLEGNNKSLNTNTRFKNIIRRIENKNQYWMVSGEGRIAVELVQQFIGIHSGTAKKLLKTITDVSISAEFSDKIKLQSVLGCSSKENAYLLSSAIKGALQMDLLTEKNYALGKMLRKMEVDRKNNTIDLSLKLNEEDLNKLREIAKRNNLSKKL